MALSEGEVASNIISVYTDWVRHTVGRDTVAILPFADSTLAVSKEGAEDYKILPLSSHFQELEGE